MTKLNYTRAIVTGSSSGIGAAIAIELCLQDIPVLAVSRNAGNLNSIRLSLPKNKQKFFIPIVADISKTQGIKKLLKAAEKYGAVDLLINNAGMGISKPFEKHTTADIENVLAINLVGTSMLTHGLLVARPGSSPLHIVFVTSLAGKMGFPNLSIYSASKFAVEGLAEALRHEYANKPIRITVLRPGVTDTNFFSVAGMEDYYNSVKKSNRIHTPESVAKKLVKNLDSNNGEITVGGDGFFLKILPFIPFRKRFKMLNLTNMFQ